MIEVKGKNEERKTGNGEERKQFAGEKGKNEEGNVEKLSSNVVEEEKDKRTEKEDYLFPVCVTKGTRAERGAGVSVPSGEIPRP